MHQAISEIHDAADASGGLGSFAVQIAAARGALVTGVTSRRNHDLVRSLGADTVIAYAEQSFLATDERYDMAFRL